jgi:uncharacterized membrane protein YccF (DUF307 family)
MQPYQPYPEQPSDSSQPYPERPPQSQQLQPPGAMPYPQQPNQYPEQPQPQPAMMPYPQQQQPQLLAMPYPQQPQPNPMQMPQQQGYPMPFPQQQPYGMPPQVNVNNYYQPNAQPMVTVNIHQSSPSFFLRVIYFLFIGWWAGFFWLNLGFFLCFTVFLLPLGLVMLNRLPTVLTLRPTGQQTTVSVSGNAVTVNIGGTQQLNFLARAVYFVFVGWWAGYFWALIGYFFCVSVILMPVGLIMLNRLPAVLTLRKN